MTSQERIERADGLYALMTHLPGEEFAESPACADVGDPEVFFPISEEDTDSIQAAKEICGGCPLRAACLERALRTAEPHGVWGGMTEWERDAILRRRSAEGERPQVSPAAVADVLDVVSGSVDAVAAGAKRAVEALERIAGHSLPLLRRRIEQMVSERRLHGDSAGQISEAVLALLRPEIERLTGHDVAREVAA